MFSKKKDSLSRDSKSRLANLAIESFQSIKNNREVKMV